MTWQVIIALVIMIPVVLIPVLLVWYINAGGILTALKEARGKKVARRPADKEKAHVSQ